MPFQVASNPKYLVIVRKQLATGVQRLQGPISWGAHVTYSVSSTHQINRKKPLTAEQTWDLIGPTAV